MKKVGIITYHFARNYGAVLQCYALQEYLNKSGYDVSILNAVSKNQENNNSLFHKRKGIKNVAMNIALLPFIKQRKEKEKGFTSFVSNYLNCTDKVTNNIELQELIESEHYDVIISGSDQVFNPHIADFEDMFLFPFKTSAKKIGYSVSVGKSTYEDLEKYAEYIRDFNELGVREGSVMPMIKKIIGRNTYNTVDPVLLLSKCDWERFVTPKKPDKEYMFCYFVNKTNFNTNLQVAKEIAKQKGLDIKVIWMHMGIRSFDGIMINNAGPVDFLNYLYNSSAVFTDSFHGTVFSTMFEKEFNSVIASSNSNDSRIKDLLSLIGLEKRIVFLNEIKIDYSPMDYKTVHSKFSDVPLASYKFLEDAINN